MKGLTPSRGSGRPDQDRARRRAQPATIARTAGATLLALCMTGCTHGGSVTAGFPGLDSALNRLVEAERTANWPVVLEMTAPEFASSHTLREFSEAADASYRRIRLASWIANAIATEEKGRPTSAWLFIAGCGCYWTDGKYQALATTTIAIPKDNGWRFDGIQVVGFAENPPPQCAPIHVPDGPCRDNADRRR